MKFGKRLLFFITIFALSAVSITFAQMRIAKVDLGLVASIHPQMALFDFDRMGFFKVAPGLSQEQFEMEVNKLRSSLPTQKWSKVSANLRGKIEAFEKQKAALIAQMSGAELATGKRVEKKLEEISREEEKIRGQLSDIEYQQNCPDLTAPAETRKILDQIEKELMTELKALADEQKYDLVLNSSITVPFNYPQRYKAGPQYGLGIPGVDFSLFYSFLANRDHVLVSDETPNSRNLINWLELIRYPDAMNLLPLKPYPMVLKGGDDISAALVERIYLKHKIDRKVIESVHSILAIVKDHDQRFDTDLESLVAPK